MVFVLIFFSNKANESGGDWAAKMIRAYENMSCLMNLKLHLVRSHLDRFPENPSQSSDEMGERAHQDLKLIEKRFAGKDHLNALTDYCWSLTRESNGACFRKSRKKGSSFKI